MDSNTLVTLVAGILVLACIITAIVLRLKSTKPSEYDKNMAKEFLEKLSDVFYTKIIEIINNIDFKEYSSLAEMEASILSQIYDTIWQFVEAELKEQAKLDVITALTLKVLNKEFVDNFINSILEKYRISEMLSSSWDKNIASIEENNIEAQDAALQKQFSGNEYYENTSKEDLKPAEKIEPTEEELSALNPPKDEDDEVVNPDNDSSVELIDDDKSYYIDGNGRKRDKITKRFV